MQVRFLSSNEVRVETKYGSIFEKSPLLDCVYEVNFTREGITMFKNVTQPHHTIMWWLEGDVIRSTGLPDIQASFEVSGAGSGSGSGSFTLGT